MQIIQLQGQEKRMNEVKKRAVQLTLELYYDSLQLWYIKDYLAWRAEVDEWKNTEGWKRIVAKIQEEVWEEERIAKKEKKARYRERLRWRRSVLRHYSW